MIRISFCLVAVFSVCGLCQSAKNENCARNEDCASDDTVSLLQAQSATVKRHGSTGDEKGFVFIHMPYNFGNTVEEVAMFDSTVFSRLDVMGMTFAMGQGSFANPPKPVPWNSIWPIVKKNGHVWGHWNPDLQVKSNVTGCPLYLTPPKYWPRETALKYIGKNKSIVAVVRDPYEKLVAQFRGAMKDYGSGVSKEDLKTCNLNGAIKEQLKKLKASRDFFQGGCVNIPQSEFFGGEFGANEPVDNWRFPMSMNEKFDEHGLPYHIDHKSIMHVYSCHDHWSAEFDDETRSLVRELYKADFDFICKHFGHCDTTQNTCLQGVHHMCPESVFEWDAVNKFYCPKPDVDVKKFNLRMRDECKFKDVMKPDRL